jgi:hypothetical protein
MITATPREDIMTARPSTVTCPPWCQNDHSVEPADYHAGRLDVLRDLDVFLFNLPGQGFTARLSGPDGHVDLRITDMAKLGPAFTKWISALVGAASA